MLRRVEFEHGGYALPDVLAEQVGEAVELWQAGDSSSRLWARDAGLWSGNDEDRWLDWLDVVQAQTARIEALQRIAAGVAGDTFRHAVLLGMGGSSLVVEVLRESFGAQAGYPDFLILDSTDPGQIRTVEDQVDLAHTLFVVASKSGSTLEPAILQAYFWRRVCDAVGAQHAAGRFVAITDPGSGLETQAAAAGFRDIFHGVPGIGGRFSALSDFGMVPAAMMGLDVRRLLERAGGMVAACAAQVPAAANPGVLLGCILAMAARAGRDKVTVLTSPAIAALGAWLEQLLAESTGKQGIGLIPVAGEQLGAPEIYGADRLFVCISLEDAEDCRVDAAIRTLEQAQQPVVSLHVSDLYDLGQEFFRWEFATAVAGSLLGINPFDQPDVEASKVATRSITAAWEAGHGLPEQPVLVRGGGLTLYADVDNARELRRRAGDHADVPGYLKAHLDRCAAGDYVAWLAWLERSEISRHVLQALRHLVRRKYRVATCVGFGPRFLHSTGQLFKGGPDSGVFLQLTAADEVDLQVPGHAYSFGVVRDAQAHGDLAVLAERRRRVLRVHLGEDIEAGLQQLWRYIEQVCME